MELKFKPGDFAIYERPTDGRRILAKIFEGYLYPIKIKLMEGTWEREHYYVSPETLHPLEGEENNLTKALDSVGLL